jgi:hypothetical protein
MLITLFLKKTGKKGLEPLSFGFGNQRSTLLNYFPSANNKK